MFILTTFSDLVQIPPHEFYKRSREEIEDKINEKYANKVFPPEQPYDSYLTIGQVVQKVGLCICMYDLLKASDGLIGHGTGNVNVNVEFRMIVFRPFKGEVITGTIKKCTPKGVEGQFFGQLPRSDSDILTVTTTFFDDIFVPQTMLFEGVVFDEKDETWVWRTEESEIWFDQGTIVNLRIEAEKWQDQAPKGPVTKSEDSQEHQTLAPYSIEASMAEAGLGGVDWW